MLRSPRASTLKLALWPLVAALIALSAFYGYSLTEPKQTMADQPEVRRPQKQQQQHGSDQFRAHVTQGEADQRQARADGAKALLARNKESDGNRN